MVFSETELLEYGIFDSKAGFYKVNRTEPKRLSFFEIQFYTEDQSGTAYLDERAVHLCRGRLICAKPGQIRSSKLHFRCLYVSLRTKDPVLKELLYSLPDVCVVEEVQPIADLFLELLRPDIDVFPAERLLLQSTLTRLLYRLHEQVGGANGENPELYPCRKEMLAVQQYIRGNLTDKLDLQSLAASVNLSASYFHKLFCRCFAMTPQAFVLGCRMSAAKTMLLEDKSSVAEIAAACGFSSQAYFNFRFKQVVGLSPLQYRREERSKRQI